MKPKAPQSLLKGTVLLTVGRSVTRLTGLVREMLSAFYFGVGPAMDCFNLSYTVVTSLRQLFGEQFHTPAVPVFFQRRQEAGEGAAVKSLSFITTRLNLVSLLISLSLLFLARPIVVLVAPGFDESQLRLSVALVRWFAVGGLAFILYRYYTVIHTCFFRYSIISFAPILMNIGAIVAMVLFAARFGVTSLAAGFSLGFIALWLVLAYFLPQRGAILKPRWGRGDPGVVSYGLMLTPLFLAVSAEQIQLYIDRALASGLPAGALSAQGYALRLIRTSSDFWLGVFTTVIFPVFSALATGQRKEEFSQKFSLAFQSIALFLMLSGTLLISLSLPLVRLLLERGTFTLENSILTAGLLRYYTVAFIAQALVYTIVHGFFAYGDTRKPMLATLIMVVITIIADFALIGPLGIAGLALALALGYGSHLIIVYALFSPRLVKNHNWANVRFFLLGLMLCVVLGSGVSQLWAVLEHLDWVGGFFGRLAGFAILSLVATLIYVLVLRLLRVPALEFILQKLKRKKSVS